MFEIVTFGSSSAGNGYLLKDGDSHLLLEAGIRPKNMQLDWSKVDGLLITHEHNDHAKYVSDYLKRGAFNVHCTPGTAEKLKVTASYRVNEHNYQEPFKVKQWLIIAFMVEHDAAEPAGFLIQSPSGKKILFATDTYYIRYKFQGITHFMIECNYSLEILARNREQQLIDYHQYKRIIKSHFELNNLIDFFKANDLTKAEEILLLHLSDRNSDKAQFIKKIEATTGVPTYVAG